MYIVMLRTVILFTLVFIVMRLMGKRQIGQLQPYELAVAIMVSALAAIPMEDISIPLINSIIPILLLLAMQVFVSTISLKYKVARGIFCGKPSILVNNGKIVDSELEKNRLNINDLLEQLRLGGYGNIADIEFAVMETNGQISIIPKSQKRALTPEDVQLSTQYEGLCHHLIIDGQADRENLASLGLNTHWLQQELSKFGIHSMSDVLFASLDTQGNLLFQEKTKRQKESGDNS